MVDRILEAKRTQAQDSLNKIKYLMDYLNKLPVYRAPTDDENNNVKKWSKEASDLGFVQGANYKALTQEESDIERKDILNKYNTIEDSTTSNKINSTQQNKMPETTTTPETKKDTASAKSETISEKIKSEIKEVEASLTPRILKSAALGAALGIGLAIYNKKKCVLCYIAFAAIGALSVSGIVYLSTKLSREGKPALKKESTDSTKTETTTTK